VFKPSEKVPFSALLLADIQEFHQCENLLVAVSLKFRNH
jgi:hypothetical protein